jgi:hypothetical protein
LFAKFSHLILSPLIAPAAEGIKARKKNPEAILPPGDRYEKVIEL